VQFLHADVMQPAEPTPPGTLPSGAGIMAVRGPHCTGFVTIECADSLARWLAAEPSLELRDARTIKESTVRTVLQGSIPAVSGDAESGALDVHLKLYRAVRWTDRARDALGGERGIVEFERLREARARGVPAIEPLAAGSCRRDDRARSFLLTRTLPGATALSRTEWPAALAARVGSLLRLAHDRGLLANDLHPGNVLIDAAGEVVLCDLHSARWDEPLATEARAHALAYFCAELAAGPLDPSAAPLLANYGAWPKLLHLATAAHARLRARGLVAFGRRATRACRHTEVLREGDQTTWFLTRDQSRLHPAAREFPCDDSREPIKSGRRGAVWLTAEFAVKRRPAPTARALFESAYRLLHAGVDAAPPIALRIRHGIGHAFFARAGEHDLAHELADGRIDDAALLRFAGRFGNSVGRLHAFGLRNRDMKLENLVLDRERGAIVMVDLDGVRRKSLNDARGQAADLGRLLAAFEALQHPKHSRVVRAFWGGYLRARRCLRSIPHPRLRKRSAESARGYLDRKRLAASKPASPGS
jgi:tRNA A-37 threonylcarbamoyl transferase component Bud32